MATCFFRLVLVLSCTTGIVTATRPLLAAVDPPESVVDRTLISAFQPVLDLLSSNGWLQGGVVILVTFTIASLITWILFKIILKITGSTRYDIDDRIAVLIRPPIYYTFLVTGVSYGLSLMPLSSLVQQIMTRSIHSLGVLVWVIALSRMASLLLNRLARLSEKFVLIERRTVTLFDNVAKILIFGVGIYLIFVIWNINMTAWLASAGVVGIAVGFAAKDTLSNLFSGVFILADAPYKVGDYVVLERGGRGRVTHIGLRSTRVLSRDDVEVTIPNSIIGNSTIVNQSGGPSEKMRIRITVGVAYGSDIDLVKETMLSIARNESQVCKSPPPTLRFRVFGASSLDFELRCWVFHPEYCSRVIDVLNSEIYKSFRRLSIEIPYAKQDLYIKDLPASLRSSLAELNGRDAE